MVLHLAALWKNADTCVKILVNKVSAWAYVVKTFCINTLPPTVHLVLCLYDGQGQGRQERGKSMGRKSDWGEDFYDILVVKEGRGRRNFGETGSAERTERIFFPQCHTPLQKGSGEKKFNWPLALENTSIHRQGLYTLEAGLTYTVQYNEFWNLSSLGYSVVV